MYIICDVVTFNESVSSIYPECMDKEYIVLDRIVDANIDMFMYTLRDKHDHNNILRHIQDIDLKARTLLQ